MVEHPTLMILSEITVLHNLTLLGNRNITEIETKQL